MSKPQQISERCPACGWRLYESFRSGKRITMIDVGRGKKPPPEQQIRMVVCLKPGCGYGREETVELLTRKI